jgi:hypothetical protein
MLADVPIVLILVGLAAYTVLAGADFGAASGFSSLAVDGRVLQPPGTTRATRWGPYGKPTTSG